MFFETFDLAQEPEQQAQAPQASKSEQYVQPQMIEHLAGFDQARRIGMAMAQLPGCLCVATLASPDTGSRADRMRTVGIGAARNGNRLMVACGAA